MEKAPWFWIAYAAWFLIAGFASYRDSARTWPGMGTWLLAWICVGLIGWDRFGSIVK